MQIDKLPKDFRCDEKLLEAYNKTEAEILPYLKRQSYRISSAIPSIDYEDALQEGRTAVVVALARVDIKRNNGEIGPYVWKVVKNCYCGMAWEAMLKSKVPHVEDVDEKGNKISRPLFPISLDAMISSDSDNDYKKYDIPDISNLPDNKINNEATKSELGKFAMKMYNTLTGMDRKVFRCKVHPSSDFLDMLYIDGEDFVYRGEDGKLILDENFDITPEQIGKYLGINKNAVGWSLYKVRRLFLEMARYDSRFIGVLDNMVVDKRWPKVHIKKGNVEDLEFKREIFKKRCLNSRQSKPSEYVEGKEKDENGSPICSRMIKWYEWGAVITIKRGREYYTVVAEGRFNPFTGAVFGSSFKDAQEHIPMKWYRKWQKELLKDA
jgi:hypothetical protein